MSTELLEVVGSHIEGFQITTKDGAKVEKRMTNKSKVVSIRLPADVLDRVRDIANSEYRSISNVLELAILQSLGMRPPSNTTLGLAKEPPNQPPILVPPSPVRGRTRRGGSTQD
jgi:hypothetical protein